MPAIWLDIVFQCKEAANMDLKAVEENADTMPLQTIDNLFRVWQRDESDVETVTNILRCLRAALALNARGEVRGHIAGVHGEALLHLAWGILKTTFDTESELARARCLLQVRYRCPRGLHYVRPRSGVAGGGMPKSGTWY